jgi:hypothetical protein
MSVFYLLALPKQRLLQEIVADVHRQLALRSLTDGLAGSNDIVFLALTHRTQMYSWLFSCLHSTKHRRTKNIYIFFLGGGGLILRVYIIY